MKRREVARWMKRRVLRAAALTVPALLLLAGCATPSPSELAATELRGLADMDAAYGMSVNDLRRVPGVRVTSQASSVPFQPDMTSVDVEPKAAKSGPASLSSLLARLDGHQQRQDAEAQARGAEHAGEPCTAPLTSSPWGCRGVFDIDGRTIRINIYTQDDGYSVSFSAPQ